MRAFILMCLMATAFAQYNYQQESGSAQLGPAISGGGGGQSYSAPAQTEYQKEFYSYSAPDGEFEDAGGHQNIANSVKKNLRVIFIKGPESNALQNAAVQLAQSTSEDRTAIYVLQKQADVGGLAQQLQQVNSQKSSKPEVHFVKYRTQQDAQNAQRTIQAQYDNLPGQSSSHNGGQAPVLNFASQAPQVSAPAPQAPSSQYLPSSLLRLRFRK